MGDDGGVVRAEAILQFPIALLPSHPSLSPIQHHHRFTTPFICIEGFTLPCFGKVQIFFEVDSLLQNLFFEQ
jgi:hypothetical protein